MKATKVWTFITNHGLILLYISQHPQCTVREMALTVKATERTVHRILMDLESAGYINRVRTGRGNIYMINREHGLKHELTMDMVVGDLINLLEVSKTDSPRN
jgi:DNA-binding IclR family transcriptional regulator